jgi:hypothetical protein
MLKKGNENNHRSKEIALTVADSFGNERNEDEDAEDGGAELGLTLADVGLATGCVPEGFFSRGM